MDHIHHAAVETQGDMLADHIGAQGHGCVPERDHAILVCSADDLDDGRGCAGLVRADASLRLGPGPRAGATAGRRR